jgi:serine/threonine-protein kinase
MASPAAPLTIGRYAFYGEIASGGMATVHFARLVGPGGFSRIVAAKRLLPHMVKDRQFSAMLMDEARLAARIRHPNVVSTLDVVSTGEELVLVMDYVHGESLAKLCRTASDLGEPISLELAITIISDALHGLHAAHEVKDEDGTPLGVVHRDISPQNLLVGADGVTRIADFGIAKASGRSHETRDGTVKGKLTYMAPEQIERGELTRATDVFAISVVLWELLTGERLFDADNDGAIVHRILSGKIPPPSSVFPSVPPVFDENLARGLARDPAQRFQTAREMAQALEAAAVPMRPSEVGAWVERVASDSLVRRSRTISKIERSLPEDVGSGQVTATKPITPAAAVALEQQGTGAKVTWEEGGSAKRGSGLLWVAALAVVVGGGASLYWFTQLKGHDGSAPSAASSPLATAPAIPTAEPPKPLEAAAVPEAPTAAPAATPSAEAVSKAPSAKPRRSEPARSKTPPAVKTPAKNCDPPYSIDASGRRIFKMECM